jgi:cbb3-type cytochrome oxidase subunit 1
MKASSLFFRTAILAAILGMGLGIGMGVMHDFALAPVHAHVNLVGWASMFLFGLYYRVTPAADGRLAMVQYGFASVGLVLFVGSLALLLLGHREFGVTWAVGALSTVVSMLIFAWNVFATTADSKPLAMAAGAAMPNAAG